MTVSPFIIGKANLSAFTALARLWEASVRASHHFLKEEVILYFRPLIEKEYLHALDVCFIQDEHGKPAGFMAGAGRYRKGLSDLTLGLERLNHRTTSILPGNP